MGIHGILLQLRDRDLSGAQIEALECEYKLECYLFDAVERNDLETVRYLLDHGMSANMINSGTRCRVLCTAVISGHLAMAKLARAYGAKLCAFYDGEGDDGTPGYELLRLAAPQLHNTGTRRKLQYHDEALLEWLLSRPHKDRSAAPPVGTPSHPKILDEIPPVLAEWQRLAAKAADEEARWRSVS